MPGLLRGIARTAVIAGTATAVSNRVSRRQAGRWSRQAEEEAPMEEEQEPVDDGPDQLDQLKKLGDLKAAGVLTDAEFQEQKAKILNS